MNHHRSLDVLTCATIIAFVNVGCDDKGSPTAVEPTKQIAAPAPNPAAAAKPSPESTNVASEKATPPALPKPPAHYEATLAEGIDFTRPGYPTFVAEVSGVARHEPWGRWSDANTSPTVKIRFKEPLPAKFTLELVAKPFGPNVDKPVKVVVGKVEKSFSAKVNPKNMYSVSFDKIKGVDTIEIVPAKPTSPNEVNPQSGDRRKIGLGLIALRIKQ